MLTACSTPVPRPAWVALKPFLPPSRRGGVPGQRVAAPTVVEPGSTDVHVRLWHGNTKLALSESVRPPSSSAAGRHRRRYPIISRSSLRLAPSACGPIAGIRHPYRSPLGTPPCYRRGTGCCRMAVFLPVEGPISVLAVAPAARCFHRLSPGGGQPYWRGSPRTRSRTLTVSSSVRNRRPQLWVRYEVKLTSPNGRM